MANIIWNIFALIGIGFISVCLILFVIDVTKKHFERRNYKPTRSPFWSPGDDDEEIG